MLTIDKQGKRRVAALVVLLALAAGGWYLWERTRVGAAGAGAGVAGPVVNGRVASGPVVMTPAADAVLASGPDGRPAFITTQDWTAIQSGLRDHPKRDDELKRIVAYLGFQHDMGRWKAMEGQADVAERARVAEQLLNALPLRLAQQEVTGAEAMLLQATLIKSMVADHASFEARIAIEKERLRQVLDNDTEMQAKLRKDELQAQEYQRLADKVMERYNAKQINELQMEQELDAARVTTFR